MPYAQITNGLLKLLLIYVINNRMCKKDLKHSKKALPETVKVTSRLFFIILKIEFPTKHLHTKKGEDYNEQKQK